MHVAVTQGDPLSFTLSLRAHPLQNSISISHGIAFFQGPLYLHGHGSWSVCKATLIHMDILVVELKTLN